MKYQIFIFNWKNQEQKVLTKIKQFQDIGYSPIIINSDDSLRDKYDWIHIGEQAYFSEQFNTAIKLFDSDIFFHIQADASYNDWDSLIKDSKKYYDKYKYGIYAPNVDYTSWVSNIVNRKHLEDNLWEVQNTDCTCWFIHKDILNEFEPIDLSQNIFGWGIDLYLVHVSVCKNRKVIRDYNHTISHPYGTNYNINEANKGMIHMFEKIKNFKSTLDNADNYDILRE